MHFNNYDLREVPELTALRAARKFPSYSTCVRWIQIFNQTGDICPLRRTGNHHVEREVQGLYNFIDHIIDDLDQNHPGRSFVFTMDNLSAHKNPLVTNRILMAGHRYVFRAPYWPVDGAVEYVFNAIQSKLRIYFNRLETMDDLRNRINLTVGGIFSFYRYFEHVGFPVPP